jgi:hypothetical protein
VRFDNFTSALVFVIESTSAIRNTRLGGTAENAEVLGKKLRRVSLEGIDF